MRQRYEDQWEASLLGEGVGVGVGGHTEGLAARVVFEGI
jgi:hypothetical protein